MFGGHRSEMFCWSSTAWQPHSGTFSPTGHPKLNWEPEKIILCSLNLNEPVDQPTELVEPLVSVFSSIFTYMLEIKAIKSNSQVSVLDKSQTLSWSLEQKTHKVSLKTSLHLTKQLYMKFGFLHKSETKSINISNKWKCPLLWSRVSLFLYARPDLHHHLLIGCVYNKMVVCVHGDTRLWYIEVGTGNRNGTLISRTIENDFNWRWQS